jgi:hypothetical protein
MTSAKFPGVALTASQLFSIFIEKFEIVQKLVDGLVTQEIESHLVPCKQCCDLLLNISRKLMGDGTDFGG